MTALVVRQPLHPLHMSSTQRPPRRLSARLQEKEDDSRAYPSQRQPPVKDVSNADNVQGANPRKRRNGYDEEDDGFAFSRVKKKKQRAPESEPIRDHPSAQNTMPVPNANGTKAPTANDEAKEPPKKRRNKLSFSTPNPKEVAPVRRSKRLSDENGGRIGSPPPKTRTKDATVPAQVAQRHLPPTSPRNTGIASEQQLPEQETEGSEKDMDREHSGTKIALPFADTPVIRRNKAMRENKSGKGERRSSLSLRGRRASSLIESGNSNALPHTEVAVTDFYKHIESDSLPEPRRMRQLLTWCATRALDQKPLGQEFEDASAIAAARVIEEELLKELSSKSELSDWFSREDVPPQPQSLPERPNPKNQQNATKVVELEEQINRLRAEKRALEALLRPPSIPAVRSAELSQDLSTYLSESETVLWQALQSDQKTSDNITTRLNSLQQNLGPTVDAFADGVHRIGQYRDAAEQVAGRILGICSEKLAERDKAARRRALEEGQETSPRRELNGVLRGLSRADR